MTTRKKPQRVVGQITPAVHDVEAGGTPASTAPHGRAPSGPRDGPQVRVSSDTPLAVLVFPLPACRAEHMAAVHGMDLACNLSALDEALRARIKYSSIGAEAKRELQAIRDQIDHALLFEVLQ